MNIQPVQSSNPVLTTAHRDFEGLRKVKRSLSLKKSDQDIINISRSNSQNSPKAKPKIPSEINVKRVENISELRKIHVCLKNAFNDPNKRIVLTEDNELKTIPNKDYLANAEINQAVIQFIYQKILKAMTSQIYYFFDDKGYFVTLTEIDKLAKLKYANIQTQTRQDVENNLPDYYETKPMLLWGNELGNENEYIDSLINIPLVKDKELEKLQSNQRPRPDVMRQLCLNVFQKMYPLSNVTNTNEEIPIISPLTFLCSYKQYVTTDELFEVALKSMSLPEKEMPYLQKLRILNFIRVWLSSHFYEDEVITRHMKGIIGKIIALGFASEKLEFTDLCHEIYSLLEEHENICFEPNPISPTKVPLEIDKMLFLDQGKTSYTNFINFLGNDIKFLASQAVIYTTTAQLFTDKIKGDAQLHYNKLVDFGVLHFIKTFEPMTLKADTKAIKQKLQQFLALFIDLAYDLTLKNDYLSSYAIFNFLSLSGINKLLLSPELKKNRGSLSSHKRQTILKSLSTEHKKQELEDLFSMFDNFSAIKNKMKECQEMHVPYIPCFAPLITDNLHKDEKINKCYEEDTHLIINSEKLKFISDLKWENNLFLEGVKSHFRGRQTVMNTDIERHLSLNDASQKLNEIADKIKNSLLAKSTV